MVKKKAIPFTRDAVLKRLFDESEKKNMFVHFRIYPQTINPRVLYGDGKVLSEINIYEREPRWISNVIKKYEKEAGKHSITVDEHFFETVNPDSTLALMFTFLQGCFVVDKNRSKCFICFVVTSEMEPILEQFKAMIKTDSPTLSLPPSSPNHASKAVVIESEKMMRDIIDRMTEDSPHEERPNYIY